MKELYIINSYYSKKIKYLKVFILFLTLTLLQIYIPMFHGNDILMDQLNKEGVDLTNYYVPYRRLYQFPQKFDEQLEHIDIKENYHVKDYKVRDVFDTGNGIYIENFVDTNFREISKGKAISDLEEGEIAISEYFAYLNFGSIRNAIGKSVEIPITYMVYEGLLNTEILMQDTLNFRITSIYKNSGINKRYLNLLGNSDNAEDSAPEIRYSDTIIVTDFDYKNIYDKYITFEDHSYNLFKKYSIYFDEYDTQKEIFLRGRLNLYVDNYNSYYIKSELNHKMLENSSLSNSTTKFFVIFKFFSLLILIVVSLIYIVYLQNKYLVSRRKVLFQIGIAKFKIFISTLFHEIVLLAIGIILWFFFNLLLILIFEVRLIYLQDIFQFNEYIVEYLWVPILIYVISTFISYLVYKLLMIKSSEKRIKNKKYEIYDIVFYRKRILALYTSKYIFLALVTLVIASSLFIINGGINTMKNVYLNSNPLNYDIYVDLQGKIVMDTLGGADKWAVISVNHESYLIHHYGEGIDNHKAMLVNAVMVYGDYETFFKKPALGDYPKYEETLGDFISKYPHRNVYPEELHEEKLGFDMLVSNSVANRLNFEIGSYGIIMLEELHRNVPQMYPISGITNIFSNDMNTVYIVPSPEKQALLNDMTKNLPRTVEEYFTFLLKYDDPLEKEIVIKKLKEHQKTGEVRDLRINDGKVRLNDLGELSTLISRVMMFITFICYTILLGAVIWAKRVDDKISQENNLNAFYNIGADSSSFEKAFTHLNVSTLVVGTVFGLILYLTISSNISNYIYEIMEVIK
ncbi:hypothetical protein [Alkaliphilus transvaalensis]|uniref:hypothetical protein n=1 Tax=Alkaliphilus transvaalensis TaxID=114628 RepID=UPI00047A2844|nr:hypothetical protein [Alkaliphilus transvaalensis]